MISYQNDKKIFLTSVVIFIITFTVTIYLFVINIEKVKTYENIKNKITSEQSQNYYSKVTQKDVDDLKIKNQILSGNFINKDEVVSLISIIVSVSEKIGIRATIDNIQEPKIDNVYGEFVEVTISTSGNYEDSKEFLGFIEKLPFKTVMNFLKIEQLNNQNDESEYKFNFSFKILIAKSI